MFLSIRSISGIGEAYIACIAPTVLNDLFEPSIRGMDHRNNWTTIRPVWSRLCLPSIPEIHWLRPYSIHFYSCSIHWKSWPCSWSCDWLLGWSITILNRVQNTLVQVKNFNLSQLFIKWIQIKVLQFLLV